MKGNATLFNPKNVVIEVVFQPDSSRSPIGHEMSEKPQCTIASILFMLRSIEFRENFIQNYFIF